MRAYKFLAQGAQGPVSGFAWPAPRGEAPGAWVEAEGPLVSCLRGAHVCRPADLAHWLAEELWELEADGEQLEGVDCLVVRRARLVRRIEGWHQGGAARFTEACIEHAVRLAAPAPEGARAAVTGYLDDASWCARLGFTAFAAFSAAVAVARLTAPDQHQAAYRDERLWQSGWIARELL